MRRVWDSGVIERAGATLDFWLKDLAALNTPENCAARLKGRVKEWATESLPAARAAYQDPATEKRIKPGTKLGDAYDNADMPVARQRMAQAGLRLAWVLNGALGEQGALE